jgi:hypothetical protein
MSYNLSVFYSPFDEFEYWRKLLLPACALKKLLLRRRYCMQLAVHLLSENRGGTVIRPIRG